MLSDQSIADNLFLSPFYSSMLFVSWLAYLRRKSGPAWQDNGISPGNPSFAPAGMPEFAQGFCLDLPDPLPGHVEFFSDLLKSPGTSVIQAEPEPQHFFLPWREGDKHIEQLFLEKRECCGFRRRRDILVRYEIAQMAVFFLSYRSFKRYGFRRFSLSPDLIHRHIHFLCYLSGCGFFPVPEQLTRYPYEFVDRFTM